MNAGRAADMVSLPVSADSPCIFEDAHRLAVSAPIDPRTDNDSMAVLDVEYDTAPEAASRLRGCKAG